MSAQSPLESRLSYAQCWEDQAVLRAALKVKKGDRVLSIASGGDNSIALAMDGASEVVAVDYSIPQLAVCELKLVGASLEYGAFLELLGLESGDPIARYHAIRPELSERARRWLDANESLLASGIMEAGRFEGYLTMFRTRVLPWVHNASTVSRMVQLGHVPSQRVFYDREWDTWRWRALFRVFFSRWVMARLGRSPEQFAQVEGAIADRLLSRVRRVMTELPVMSNPYVTWILTGETPIDHAHPYLTPDGHARLRQVRGAVRLVHGGVGEYLETGARGFDAFNLSNICEYLSEEEWATLYHQVVEAARPGTRVAYWNLFVPRQRPEALADRVMRHPGQSAALYAKDRAMFYAAFHLETCT